MNIPALRHKCHLFGIQRVFKVICDNSEGLEQTSNKLAQKKSSRLTADAEFSDTCPFLAVPGV